MEDGAILLSVSSNVVDESQFPAVLDPNIGPELEIDEPVALLDVQDQTRPVIGFNGSEHLVKWTDKRHSGTYDKRVDWRR